MADADTFHCNLVTPDRQLLDCDARFAAIPAHDGEIGFLKNRAPLVCKLGAGSLRIESSDAVHQYFLDGGFAEMFENNLTILTPRAELVEEIDRDQAAADFQAALAMPANNQEARDAKNLAVARARARRHVALSARPRKP